MQIEVPLGADVGAGGKPRGSFAEQPLGKARAYPETDRFVPSSQWNALFADGAAPRLRIIVDIQE